jgi:hypothetical protein
MPDHLPFVPDATLDLVDAGWWLELRCACGRSAFITHKMLVRAHGPSAWVPHLLGRLRCRTCRRRPILAQWVDDIRGGPPSYPAPKRVPLALAWQRGPAAIN